MPSFDIVSKVDTMEVKNAVNQANKEISTRFDFKGSDAKIEHKDNEILLTTKNEHGMQALSQVLMSKLAKRNISLKNVQDSGVDVSPLGHARQTIKFQQGIPGDHAKTISAKVRAMKLKVTAAIQGDLIRVTGKSRDDLQQVIAMLKNEELPLHLAFENFRS